MWWFFQVMFYWSISQFQGNHYFYWIVRDFNFVKVQDALFWSLVRLCSNYIIIINSCNSYLYYFTLFFSRYRERLRDSQSVLLLSKNWVLRSFIFYSGLISSVVLLVWQVVAAHKSPPLISITLKQNGEIVAYWI